MAHRCSCFFLFFFLLLLFLERERNSLAALEARAFSTEPRLVTSCSTLRPRPALPMALLSKPGFDSLTLQTKKNKSQARRGQPNPTQPNPTQPNPTQPNPTQSNPPPLFGLQPQSAVVCQSNPIQSKLPSNQSIKMSSPAHNNVRCWPVVSWSLIPAWVSE